MRIFHLLLLLSLLFFSAHLAASKIETYEFSEPEQEKIYKKLIEELRCLVCQNQNLEDSNAELAQDLRRKTYEMASRGLSEQEIVDYMVQRYGDFVLYKPPMQANTLLLWTGPFIIFVVSLIVLIRTIRSKPEKNAVLSAEDRAEAERLLSSKEED